MTVLESWRLRVANVNEVRSQLRLLLLAPQPMAVEGSLRGPLCEYATTLVANYSWTKAAPPPNADPRLSVYSVEITESCLWEPAHPFLYEGSWRVAGAEEHKLRVGLRTLQLRRGQLTVNANSAVLRGLAVEEADEDRLKMQHDWGVTLLHSPLGPPLLADKYGPFATGALPEDLQAAAEMVATAGPNRPSIGIWIDRHGRTDDERTLLRRQDPTTLFASWRNVHDAPTSAVDDLVVLEGTQRELLAATAWHNQPWLAAVHHDEEVNDRGAWDDLKETLDALLERPNCVGWLAGPGRLFHA